MKKIWKLLTVLFACVMLAFGFVACANKDENGNGTNTESSSSGAEESSDTLSFKTLTAEGLNVYGKVSNATTEFDFKNEIVSGAGATYTVSLDEYGIQTSMTKKVPLNVGDNVFYIFVETDVDTKTYTVTIRCRPTYSVTFDTDGGTAVESQTVEEDSMASMPTAQPTRAGYTFKEWEYDFTKPITGETTVNAGWTINEYVVEYQLNGGEISGVEAVDGVITDTYTVVSNMLVPTRFEYEFLGWYSGETRVSSFSEKEGRLTLTAKWQSIYKVSENTITGLTDYGKANYTILNIPSVIAGVEITSIGWYAFIDCESLTSVTIGDGVTTIGEYAFYYCGNLTSVTIGDSVTTIGDSAFGACDSLTSVTIPDSVTTIGDSAFGFCDSLTSVTVLENNTAYKSIDGNLYSKDGTKLIQYVAGKTATSFTIPDSVTSIGEYAFIGCGSLKSVTIGDSVTTIGEYAFYGCSSLTSVTIGDSVTTIGEGVFSHCESLTSITFEGTVAEWNALVLYGGNYNEWYYVPADKVVCKDGEVSI